GRKGRGGGRPKSVEGKNKRPPFPPPAGPPRNPKKPAKPAPNAADGLGHPAPPPPDPGPGRPDPPPDDPVERRRERRAAWLREEALYTQRRDKFARDLRVRPMEWGGYNLARMLRRTGEPPWRVAAMRGLLGRLRLRVHPYLPS